MTNPAPTFTEAWTTAANRIHLFEELDKFCNSNAENFTSMQATLEAAFEGVYTRNVSDDVATQRRALSALLAPDRVRAAWTPLLLEIARAASIESRDLPTLIRDLVDYMVDNAETINSRGLTYDTPTAGGGNVGDGRFIRVTVDKDNNNIEHIFAEAKSAICTADQGTVDKHAEEFTFKGAPAESDFLEVTGTALNEVISGINERTSGEFVQNPYFSNFTGTTPTAGVPTAVTDVSQFSGWTLDTTDAEADIDTIFRGGPDGGTPISCRFTDNNKLRQQLNETVNPVFSPDVPYVFDVKIFREGNCDGTITFRVGSQSTAIAMTSLTNNTWSTLQISGQNGWYDNFNEDDLDIEIELTARTAGTLYVHGLDIGGMTPIDGTWYAIIGGVTPFMRDDVFTWTDTEAGARGILQYWLLRGGLPSLPSNNAGGETQADP